MGKSLNDLFFWYNILQYMILQYNNNWILSTYIYIFIHIHTYIHTHKHTYLEWIVLSYSHSLVSLSVRLWLRLFVCLSTQLYLCPFHSNPIHSNLFMHLSIQISVCLFGRQSDRQTDIVICTCTCMHESIYLSGYTSPYSIFHSIPCNAT